MTMFIWHPIYLFAFSFKIKWCRTQTCTRERRLKQSLQKKRVQICFSSIAFAWSFDLQERNIWKPKNVSTNPCNNQCEELFRLARYPLADLLGSESPRTYVFTLYWKFYIFCALYGPRRPQCLIPWQLIYF